MFLLFFMIGAIFCRMNFNINVHVVHGDEKREKMKSISYPPHNGNKIQGSSTHPSLFEYDFDLGRFSASEQHKLKQLRDLAFPNDFLNLIRLYVVNWDIYIVL